MIDLFVNKSIFLNKTLYPWRRMQINLSAQQVMLKELPTFYNSQGKCLSFVKYITQENMIN